MEKEKNDAREERKIALQKAMYYKNEEGEHEGFIGKAYNNVIDLFKSNEKEAVKIAGTELQHLSNNIFDFHYEKADYDNIYTVKYTYAYAQHFNHIYRKLLQAITEDYVKNNGLRIISIGAGNFVDYWSLESALYMEEWAQETINKIHYSAYEYKRWGVELQIKGNRHPNTFQIPVENIHFFFGKKGNFFNIKYKQEDKKEVKVVVFPSSFNELLWPQRKKSEEKKSEKSKIVKVLKRIEPNYIITMGHRSGSDEEEIEAIIKGYCDSIELIDQFKELKKKNEILKSVMPEWEGDNNITNNDGTVQKLEGIEGIGQYRPMKNLINEETKKKNVSHTIYKIIK